MMKNRLRSMGRYLWRYQAWLAAAALVSAMGAVPAIVVAAGDAPQAAPGGRIEEIVVSKTPYYTNIEAKVSGKIENTNSFKLNDPFRIVVDIWGVAQGAAASEIPAGTPQVKSVKLSQQGDKLRMLVETPDDLPLPFLVTTEGNRLVLSVGGGLPRHAELASLLGELDRFHLGLPRRDFRSRRPLRDPPYVDHDPERVVELEGVGILDLSRHRCLDVGVIGRLRDDDLLDFSPGSSLRNILGCLGQARTVHHREEHRGGGQPDLVPPGVSALWP